MWVYKETSLEHRLHLDGRIAFWLDYWLFLHSEETHPIWSSRPLSTRAIAQAVLESTSGHDAALRRQLKFEIQSIVRLSQAFSCAPPTPSEPLAADASAWSATWLQWCQQLLQIDHNNLLRQLIDALAESLGREDLSEAAYYIRRLACELGDDEWSQGELFAVAKHAVCDSGRFADLAYDKTAFAELLYGIFTSRPTSPWEVALSVAPTPVTRFIIKRLFAGPAPQVREEPDGRRMVTGITCNVDAAHPQGAVAAALEQAHRFLHVLRLRFYVTTHVYGAVKVVNSSTSEEYWFSLPQPFWKKQPGRRAVPQVPGRFDSLVAGMAEDDQARWHGARWHLSRAFSDWSEDQHGATAECWQALEAFAPGHGTGLAKVLPIVPDYLAQASNDIAKHLATRVSLQARELKSLFERQGQLPDWYYWVSTRIELEKWYGRVLDERSTNHCSNWSHPPAPPIAFDEKVGLLQIISRRVRNSSSESWMERRIESNLALLYGLRNKAVHAGAPILPHRMARYLGQLAAEVIFTLMEPPGPAVSAP